MANPTETIDLDDEKTIFEIPRGSSGRKPETCHICQKTVSPNNIRRHILTHARDQFACKHPECGAKFTKAEHLRRHAQRHSLVASSSAPPAEKSFQDVPDPELVFPLCCGGCEAMFSRVSSAAVHARSHGPVPRFVCKYPNCNRAFVREWQLMVHGPSHNKPDRFFCTFPGCSSSYVNTRSLQKHEHEVHGLKTSYPSDFPLSSPSSPSQAPLDSPSSPPPAPVAPPVVPPSAPVEPPSYPVTPPSAPPSSSDKSPQTQLPVPFPFPFPPPYGYWPLQAPFPANQPPSVQYPFPFGYFPPQPPPKV